MLCRPFFHFKRKTFPTKICFHFHYSSSFASSRVSSELQLLSQKSLFILRLKWTKLRLKWKWEKKSETLFLPPSRCLFFFPADIFLAMFDPFNYFWCNSFIPQDFGLHFWGSIQKLQCSKSINKRFKNIKLFFSFIYGFLNDILSKHWTSFDRIQTWSLNLICKVFKVLSDQFLKNGPYPASFSLFSSFLYSWQ